MAKNNNKVIKINGKFYDIVSYLIVWSCHLYKYDINK